jgi:hypothetical protein
VIEAQEMIVTYQPNWVTDVGHFEFRSLYEPPRRIPVSETGYRSHFASMADVATACSPQDYARDLALALLHRNDREQGPEGDQLPLF